MSRKQARRLPGCHASPPPRRGALLLSTGLGLMAVVQLPPAVAAEPSSTTVRWSGFDEVVRGTVPVKANVSADAAVDGWALRLLTPDGGTAVESLCNEDFSRPKQSFTVQCRWDTVHDASGGYAANGNYVLRLMTRQGDGLAPAQPDRAAAVANPATAPGQVVATTTAEGRTVLSWAANPEPDVLHYDVEERTDSNTWTRLGEPAGTTFEAAAGASGNRLFRVAAERRSADGGAVAPTSWTSVRSGSGRRGGSGRRPESGEGTGSGETQPEAAEPAKSPQRGERPPAQQDGSDTRTEPGRSGADGGREPAKAGRPPRNEEGEPSGGGSSGSGAASSAEPGGPRSAKRGSPGSAKRGSPGSAKRGKPRSGQRGTQRPAEPDTSRPHKPDEPAPTTPDDAGPADVPPPARPADTPPADRANLGFSRSSSDAFRALAAASHPAARRSTPAPVTLQATRPGARQAEPDAGFGQTLPYPRPEGPAIPEESAAPVPAAAPAPMPEPSTPRRSNTRQRAEGLALATAGFALLGFLARPSRRSRGRGAAAVPTGEPAPTLAELATRVESLEARLGGAQDGTR